MITSDNGRFQSQLPFAALLQTSRHPLVALDAEFRVHAANPAFYQAFAAEEGETLGLVVYELAGGAWDCPQLRELLEVRLEQDDQVEDFTFEHELPRVGYRVLKVNACRLACPPLVLLAIEDTTEQELNRRWRQLVVELDSQTCAMSSPEHIVSYASEAVRQHLGIREAIYCEIAEPGDEESLSLAAPDGTVRKCSIQGDLGADAAAALAAGLPVLVADAEKELQAARGIPLLGRLQARSFLCVPTSPQRSPRALLALVHDQPRLWSKEEVVFSEMVATVLWSEVEQAKAECRLRESESRYRGIVESEVVGILFWQADGRAVGANQTLLDLLGYTREEMESGNIFCNDLTLPKLAAKDRAILEQLHRTGRAAPQERQCVCKDGTRKPVLVATSFLPGRRDLGVAFVVDIADRKRAEQALRESEQRFHSIFHQAAVGIALVSPQLQFMAVNPALCKLHGYTQEELLARTVLDITFPDDLPAVQQRIQSLLAGEVSSYLIEKRNVRKDGSVVWVAVTATIVRSADGEPLYLLGIAQDITARRRAEEQLRQLMESLERRVAERTALAEQNSAELHKVARELTRAEQRERRRVAHVLHDHLQQLLISAKMHVSVLRKRIQDEAHLKSLAEINDVLDLSISSTRSLSVELCPPILYEHGLGAALEWLARRMEQQHQLRVTVELEAEACPAAIEVGDLLFQGARELLLNVVKHAEVDEARLRMRRRGGQVQIEVIDRGRGFQTAVCEPEASSVQSFGLCHIRQRLRQIGGTLEIESAPGQGTRAVLTAPA